MIESSLQDSLKVMERNIYRLGTRGERIDEIEKKSNQLMDSSYEFVERFDPLWKRVGRQLLCCPKWWCVKSNHAEGEVAFDTLPMIEIE